MQESKPVPCFDGLPRLITCSEAVAQAFLTRKRQDAWEADRYGSFPMKLRPVEQEFLEMPQLVKKVWALGGQALTVCKGFYPMPSNTIVLYIVNRDSKADHEHVWPHHKSNHSLLTYENPLHLVTTRHTFAERHTELYYQAIEVHIPLSNAPMLRKQTELLKEPKNILEMFRIFAPPTPETTA